MKYTLLLLVLFTGSVAFAQRAQLKAEHAISLLHNDFKNSDISFNIQQATELFGLPEQTALVPDRAETDALGYVHYRCHQILYNIPVVNSMFIIHTKKGQLYATSGSIILDTRSLPARQQNKRIGNATAISRAIAASQAKRFAWQDAAMEQALKKQQHNSNATYYPRPALVYYNPGKGLDISSLRLCYQVDIYAIDKLQRTYFYIDASTGEILGKNERLHLADATGTAKTAYSATQTIHSAQAARNVFLLRDSSKNAAIITLHGETDSLGLNYTSRSRNWELTGVGQAALDAHYGVTQTYLFYQQNFGRNSYDNQGTALTSYVNNTQYTDNAFWDGTSMNFCKRSNGNTGGVTGIDVCGHELTHGVTQETCNLVYSYESGAINESLSDIMGKAVQFWSKPADSSWVLSNDMAWELRDLSNPGRLSQPDTYKGAFWITSSFDLGGVHTNSGVGNFMFYLMVHGGTGINDNGDAYDVKSIGLTKAMQIIYRSQVLYLTPTSQYYDWRIACISAATDLYGSASAEVSQVKNAFYAVGVGPDANGCDAPYQLQTTDTTRNAVILRWSPTAGIGYNIQYKLATSGNFTSITNVRDTFYHLTGLKPGLSYDWKVQSNCDSEHNGLWSVQAAFATLARRGSIAYCTSTGSFTSGEYIQSISLNGFTNRSGDNKGYGNYTNKNIKLLQNNVYNLSVTAAIPGTNYQEPWSAYIDYNADGDFSDAGELIGTVTTLGTSPGTLTFKVPENADAGSTRMRIQLNAPASSPCGTFIYGEVEDYGIKIDRDSAKTITFDKQHITNPAGLAVSPNPVTGSTVNASFRLPETGSVTIRINTLSGQTLLMQTQSALRSGINYVTIGGLHKIGNGTYFVILEQKSVVIGRTQLFIHH